MIEQIFSFKHDGQACVHLARRLAYQAGKGDLGPLHERANLLLVVHIEYGCRLEIISQTFVIKELFHWRETQCVTKIRC